MTDLRIDPEFRDLIPPLSSDERKGLEENIKADGCHTPLFVWGDIIIDGHNRYEICTKHGIDFETQPWEFDDRRDARIWILRNQFDRRNLSETQRMDLALILKSELQARAQERMRAGKKDPSPKSDQGRTDTKLAKTAGVGKTKLREYEAVKETGTPELVKATQEGRLPIHTAAKAAKTLSPAEQLEVLKSAPGKIGKIVNDEIKRHEFKKVKDESFREMVKEANELSLPKGHDPKQHEARLQRLHSLYDAIECLSTMPLPSEIISWIPDYQHKRFQKLDAAMTWLNEFGQLYKETERG